MVSCPICKSERNSEPLQKHREPGIEYLYTRYSCLECGGEFWTPLIMPPASYYEQATGDYVEFHSVGSDVIKWWHKSFIDSFPDLTRKGKILDIGCADGRLLKEMKNRGWDIYGIDFDRLSIAVAKKKCESENIFALSLDEFIDKMGPQTFDLITFFEVLEHQPDPAKFFDGIKRLLKPDGMIAGSLPNRDRYIVRNRFSPDNPPHHFTFWGKDTLKSFIERMGFKDCTIKNTRYAPIMIDQILRNATYERMQRLKNDPVSIQSTVQVPSTVLTVTMKLKRYLWNPFYAVIGLFEYPYLLMTKKSISLYFHATMNDNAR
jgi:SAM-dependent methyltransferase